MWFQEVITEWDKPRALRYRFVVPKGAMPREAPDERVEINGDYFELVDGGTDLSLTTRFLNKSHMKTYGDVWGKLVLKDFHRSILSLMKSRAERVHAGGQAYLPKAEPAASGTGSAAGCPSPSAMSSQSSSCSMRV